MRLDRSCGRVKAGKDLGKKDVKRLLPLSEEAQKILKQNAVNHVLLLPSHRAYGIFGMGSP
jgi:hypothetical protein